MTLTLRMKMKLLKIIVVSLLVLQCMVVCVCGNETRRSKIGVGKVLRGKASRIMSMIGSKVSHRRKNAKVVEDSTTCTAGEGMHTIGGAIFTSGDASQCSGLSKITTAEECELAAEYNRRNNIDKNGGYGSRMIERSTIEPSGCLYESISSSNKYVWNAFTKSTKKCSKYRKCI